MNTSQDTKQKLLTQALNLFAKQGFDQTSIQQIISASKVSKGAFYHYFSSKEEILDEIAENYADKALAIIEKTANDTKLNAVQKFNRMVVDIQVLRLSEKKQHGKLRKILKSDLDPKWQQKFLEKFMKTSEKPFEKIFRQGVAEGLFETKYPSELAKFYFPFAAAFKQTFLLDKKDIRKKMECYEDILNRMLGAKAGSIQIAKPILDYLKKRS